MIQAFPANRSAFGACMSVFRRGSVLGGVCLMASCLFVLLASSCCAGGEPVEICVDPASQKSPISPLVYGANHDIAGFNDWTAMRLCGNRMTTTNWENGDSNAGHDGIPKHTNDDWWLVEGLDVYWPRLEGGAKNDFSGPGGVYRRFHEEVLSRGAYSLVGLQLAGFVAADAGHLVKPSEKAPSSRWAKVMLESPKRNPSGKNASGPDLSDSVIYTDELIQFLLSIYGPASQGLDSSSRGIRGYSLDNEPGLWHETHPLMHPEPATCGEVMNKSVALAKLVKRLDPGAETFGPALWGVTGYVRLSDDSDFSEVNKDNQYAWFIDWYLDQMNQASKAAGTRLLDVLDLHWYADTENFQNGGAKAIANAPRSLWDESYREPSWIGQYFNQHLPLLKKAQASIDRYFPGTKLAITEYNFTLADQIHGGLAQADALGAFGRQGVYMANYYQPVWGADDKYVAAAFNLYRNYDGQGGAFGDTSVEASSGDTDRISVYASVSSEDDSLHVILVNRDDQPSTCDIKLEGRRDFRFGGAYVFDATDAKLKKIDHASVFDSGVLPFTANPLSATHIIFQSK